MFKQAMVIGAMLGASMAAQAFMPQAGMWMVKSERNGQPGRGFGLDVQNDTLVLSVYAYDQNGNSTFYLSAGKYASDRYVGELNKYRGGRYFGSGDRVGKEDGSAGQVSMRFVSGTKGYITFPGEPEKEIARFDFGYNNSQQHLRGVWMLSAVNRNSSSRDQIDYFGLEDAVQGTSYGAGAMVSRDRTYWCENLVRGPNAGYVMCVKFNSNDDIQRVNYFEVSVNDGEGVAGGATGALDDVLYVKRVTNPSGDFIGLSYKDAPVTETEEVSAAKRQAMEQAALLPVDRSLMPGEQAEIVSPVR